MKETKQLFDVSQRGDIAVLQMSYGKANAIDLEFCRGIEEQLEEIRKSSAKALVLTGEGTFSPPTTIPENERGTGVPYATYAFAAQIAEVEVDVDLGTVCVLRIAAAHDVGKAINPVIVEGQIHGGIAQGLGMALMEEYLPGVTEDLHNYLMPTFGDVPEITSIIVEDPEPSGPWGAKGIGEPALIPPLPAIFGGIHHAIGVRMKTAPATPDRVRRAILDLAEPCGGRQADGGE